MLIFWGDKMIWSFIILNIVLFLEICISTYMISYCKKQEFDYSIFKIGLKSYLFLMITGLITAIVDIFILNFGFFRHLSSYCSKDVPPFAIYIVITGFVIGIFTNIDDTSCYIKQKSTSNESDRNTISCLFYDASRVAKQEKRMDNNSSKRRSKVIGV